jgi:4-diphosphocytidyl-2-C-methyl-D-erythritol kinase
VTEPARLVAPAKLTIELRVLGVRDDGMHLVDAEMVTLDLHDVVVVDPTRPTGEITASGPFAAQVPVDDSNLAARALALANRSGGLHVVKRIPAGAGLGGGSADAAAILRWAGVDDLAVAARLGSDVAFCLVGGRARVRGIGEVVEPLPHVERTVTLLTPAVHCSTPAVYRRWDEMGGPTDEGGNDLTAAALSVAPELARARDELEAATGRPARLAGSGSTWFVDGAHPGPGLVVARSVPTGWSPG